MSTAVLDTNVWLDWLVFDDPGTRELAARLTAGQLAVVATDRMRDELGHVLRRPGIADRGLAPEAALARFDARVTIVAASGRCPLACRDPDDQMFVDLAVGARARWLLTRDKALLALARRAGRDHGVAVLTPSRWRPDL